MKRTKQYENTASEFKCHFGVHAAASPYFLFYYVTPPGNVFRARIERIFSSPFPGRRRVHGASLPMYLRFADVSARLTLGEAVMCDSQAMQSMRVSLAPTWHGAGEVAEVLDLSRLAVLPCHLVSMHCPPACSGWPRASPKRLLSKQPASRLPMRLYILDATYSICMQRLPTVIARSSAASVAV